MKYSTVLAGVAALGLLATNATSVQAQVFLKCTFTLTGQMQGPASSTQNTQKFTIDKTKLDNKDILQILDSYYSTTFPTTAVIELVDFSYFAVYSQDPNNNGTLIQKIGTNIMSYTPSTQVFQENRNLSNNSFSGMRVGYVTINLGNGAGTTLNLSGFAQDNYSGNSANGKYSHSINLNTVAGTGTSTSGFIVVSGKITLKGSGTD